MNLEQAKDILYQISKEGGGRMIAEVLGHDSLQKDPHFISGKPQKKNAGFNNAWGDWSGIRWMLDISEKFLKNVTGELKKDISFQRALDNPTSISYIYVLIFTLISRLPSLH